MKVRLGFTDHDNDPSWFFDTVRFKDKSTGAEFGYEYKNWVLWNEEKDAIVEFPVIWPNRPVLPREYTYLTFSPLPTQTRFVIQN